MNDVQMFVEGLEKLETITDPPAKPRVAILGAFNAGKSTLLNSLLGEKLSPVGAIPSTFCPFHFVYGGTFKATVFWGRGKQVFRQRDEFHCFLNQLKTPLRRIIIEYPAPLLKRCCLTDTPGIDSFHGEYIGLVEQEAREADKVLYLFHQRGIEDFNRLFLYKLSSIWKNRNPGDISFWLNCNLGLTDGSSLELTRAALREIFLSPVKLNTINTLKKDNIDFLRLYLEVALARTAHKQTSAALKKIESELPRRIEKTTNIGDDSMFLSEFWRIRETARVILNTRRFLHTLPPVIQALGKLSSSINSGNIEAETGQPGGRPYRPGTVGVKEGRNALLELLDSLLTAKETEPYLDRTKLSEHYNRIEAKRFTVAAAGGFSTGKSTFFNALLKDDLLPRADGPTTASLTRISYGQQKRATVHYPLQATLKMYDSIGDRASLRLNEMAALENWIHAADSPVSFFETASGGRFQHVSGGDMDKKLKHLKELFAAGAFARTRVSPALPAAFKPIPLKRLKAGKTAEEVRVTFKKAGTMEFDLSHPMEVNSFRNLVTSRENVFRIELVEILYPCEYLKLADFIDTPGLDWIQKHHYKKTRQIIQECDICLIFLNARHILNNMDKEHFGTLFGARAQRLIGKGEIPGREEEKYFFLINFADVLSLAQQEAAANFVRKKLTSPAASEAALAFSKPRIFLLSALKGLTGEDKGQLGAFLKRLEEGILGNSGRAFYLASVEELFFMLSDALRRIRDDLQTGAPILEQKKRLSKAQEILRRSNRRLKEIRNVVFFSGP